MACFVVAVVPDYVAVVVRRSSASGRVFVLLRTWRAPFLAADCWLIISSSVSFLFWHTSAFQLLDIQAVVTGRPSLAPSGYCLHFFWRIGFGTH